MIRVRHVDTKAIGTAMESGRPYGSHDPRQWSHVTFDDGLICWVPDEYLEPAPGPNPSRAAEIRATGRLVATLPIYRGDTPVTPIEIWRTSDREFFVLEGDWIAAEVGMTIRQAFNVAAKTGGWG
jgi:hypothetical protein